MTGATERQPAGAAASEPLAWTPNGGEPQPLGAVIAGGRSSRYGEPKALSRIGGRRLIDRVVDALSVATSDIVLIANDPVLAAVSGLPSRPDALEGLGALGGIHAALCWARELRRPGVLAVACDMPFLEPALLIDILGTARERMMPDVVLPESEGRRGVEPLCAYYGTRCVAAIERAASQGDRRMIGFHDQVSVVRVPLDVVKRYPHADRIFFNVNTTADRDLAERVLSREPDRFDVV